MGISFLTKSGQNAVNRQYRSAAMKRGIKVVKIHDGRWRKRLLLMLVILAVLAVFAYLIAVNVLDEYHTYHSSQATEFQTSKMEKDGLLLSTSVKKLLGKTYAGFAVSDPKTGEAVYQCPDLYLVKDLESIGWGPAAYTVLVTPKAGSVVAYSWDGTKWEKR